MSEVLCVVGHQRQLVDAGSRSNEYVQVLEQNPRSAQCCLDSSALTSNSLVKGDDGHTAQETINDLMIRCRLRRTLCAVSELRYRDYGYRHAFSEPRSVS